jgi:hypothetical protein
MASSPAIRDHKMCRSSPGSPGDDAEAGRLDAEAGRLVVDRALACPVCPSPGCFSMSFRCHAGENQVELVGVDGAVQDRLLHICWRNGSIPFALPDADLPSVHLPLRSTPSCLSPRRPHLVTEAMRRPLPVENRCALSTSSTQSSNSSHPSSSVGGSEPSRAPTCASEDTICSHLASVLISVSHTRPTVPKVTTPLFIPTLQRSRIC